MTMLPPVQFDHPYNGMVIEMTMTAEQVAMVCKNPLAEACTIIGPNFPGDKCFIVIPKVGPGGVSQRTQTLLRRHEVGHCNGWGSNHAGGR